MPALTVNLWKAIKDEEWKRTFNAAIKKDLEYVDMLTATIEGKSVVDMHDTANPFKDLLDLIRKQQKAGLEKIK